MRSMKMMQRAAVRPASAKRTAFQQVRQMSGQRNRVTVIGSGNWGSVAARIVGQNALSMKKFDDLVNVWVFEEDIFVAEQEIRETFDMLDLDHQGKIDITELRRVAGHVGLPMSGQEAYKLMQLIDHDDDGLIGFEEFSEWWHSAGHSKVGRKLTEIINATNQNVKYLPGVRLGANVKAVPELLDAVADSNLLVFVTPHQFINGICDQLKGKIQPGTRAISLIKGMDVTPDGFKMISGVVKQELDIDCAVLMGANIANEIGLEKFSEATVACHDEKTGEMWKELFHTDYFHVRSITDVEGTELCGTLKNIVALGAGFVDGLKMGNNTKAAIIRIGMVEMKLLAQELYPSVSDQTFFESCGMADLITTCFGGRNRKCAEAYVEKLAAGTPATFDDIEAELLNGQKLQGVLTSNEVQEVLEKKDLISKFPLFTTINRIVNGQIPPEAIVQYAEFP